MLGNFLVMASIVLLPLVPAYLLFRLLPTEARVDGPWHGLKIKLSGAFGGYFLVMITLFAFWRSMPAYDLWNVDGSIVFADRPEAQVDERAVYFVLRPSDREVYGHGLFRLALHRIPDHSGFARFPTLIVEHQGYHPVYVDLESLGERKRLRRRVVLSQPLVLQPRPQTEDQRP